MGSLAVFIWSDRNGVSPTPGVSLGFWGSQSCLLKRLLSPRWEEQGFDKKSKSPGCSWLSSKPDSSGNVGFGL